MGFTLGKNFKVTVFGESHGDVVGVVIEGLPAGFVPNLAEVDRQLSRRRGGSSGTTARLEADKPQILSGLFEGHTTLSPLVIVFNNENTQSKDYQPLAYLMRPGHSDYPAYIKSGGFNDYRGGGGFSARITTPLVAAGSLVRQLFHKQDIVVGSQVTTVGRVNAPFWTYPEPTYATLASLADKAFPVANEILEMSMEQAIEEAMEQNDSLGGVIQLAVLGLPVGIGEPLFDGLESVIAHALFSVPSVKAVEFGDGFALARTKGSKGNDLLSYQNNRVTLLSNHQGGINGGLSNGNPLIVVCTLRAPASIGKAQTTINVKSQKNEPLKITGRHDCCPTKRAAVILESVLALALADFLIKHKIEH